MGELLSYSQKYLLWGHSDLDFYTKIWLGYPQVQVDSSVDMIFSRWFLCYSDIAFIRLGPKDVCTNRRSTWNQNAFWNTCNQQKPLFRLLKWQFNFIALKGWQTNMICTKTYFLVPSFALLTFKLIHPWSTSLCSSNFTPYACSVAQEVILVSYKVVLTQQSL